MNLITGVLCEIDMDSARTMQAYKNKDSICPNMITFSSFHHPTNGVGRGWCCFLIEQKLEHIFIDIILKTEACEGISSYVQGNMVQTKRFSLRHGSRNTTYHSPQKI
jgi:hypothetical protein